MCQPRESAPVIPYPPSRRGVNVTHRRHRVKASPPRESETLREVRAVLAPSSLALVVRWLVIDRNDREPADEVVARDPGNETRQLSASGSDPQLQALLDMPPVACAVAWTPLVRERGLRFRSVIWWTGWLPRATGLETCGPMALEFIRRATPATGSVDTLERAAQPAPRASRSEQQGPPRRWPSTSRLRVPPV